MPVKPDTVDHYMEAGCGRCPLGGTPDCKVLGWTEEIRLLRAILLESDLKEEIKWSAPCYTHDGKNILMLSALKACVVVSFFEGAQLSDPKGLLEKPGEHSRYARYIRITNAQQIAPLKADLLRFIEAAIQLKDTDKQTDQAAPLAYPEELISCFNADPNFEAAFLALTPGRQRGYLIHFSSAKQSATRSNRIKKAMPKIFAGKGWNER